MDERHARHRTSIEFDLAPMPSYEEIADWYDEWVGEPTTFADLVVPAVIEMAGSCAGLLVCDLACGQGIAGRKLRERGARVVGVDLSMRFLEHGRRRDGGMRYVRGDARWLPLRDGAFDVVLCNMSLMDIDSLERVAKEVTRVLRGGGWFFASITHPCFQTPVSAWTEIEGRPARTVSAYFDEGFWRSAEADSTRAAFIRGRVGAEHRRLATYLNTFRDAGLVLDRLEEPRASGAAAKRVPGYAETPAVLLIRWEKPR